MARSARAPYNFVELPERVIEPPPLARHDVFEGLSGHFDVTLTTRTPLYIRGMLTAKQTEANEAARKRGDETLPHNTSAFFSVGGRPTIPGSSLRGMLRTLVEIITFSKIQPVGDSQPMFFRAVAAKGDDPLKNAYEQTLGKFGKRVRAGYLDYDGKNWYVQPARRFDDEPYAKVKDRQEVVERVKGLQRFNARKYRIQYHHVCYRNEGKRVVEVYTPAENEEPTGVLVCSGNMLETSGDGQTKSPRKNYALVLLPDTSRAPILIPKSVVQDYVDGLTPFMTEKPLDKYKGVLKKGRPVFFVAEGEQVLHFGHTPNFRVAPLTQGNNGPRAITPGDRVPSDHRNPDLLDYAESMFGYVADEKRDKNSKLPQAWAGRVSVTSAHLMPDQTNIGTREIQPKILGSPKPTTFQHYLEQPQGVTKRDLHHYGDPAARIRGHKLYWRQRISGVDNAEEKEPDPSKEKVYAHPIKPLRDGVHFQFRVYFENFSGAELGALAWALTLGDEPQYYHMLGMGKPYGLGVVKLAAALHLCDPLARYTHLFAGDNWETGCAPADIAPYIDEFKQEIRQQLGRDFDAHPRIQALRDMLRLYEPDAELTYMQIQPDNEFKDRPVLPLPDVVARRLTPVE